MDISPVAIGSIIAGIFLVGSDLIQRVQCVARSETFDVSTFEDTEFRCSAIAYWAPVVCVIFGGFFLYCAYTKPWGKTLYLALGLAAIGGSAYLFNRLPHSAVVFSKGLLEYREGKKHRRTARLRDIAKVSLGYRVILVDLKDGSRIGISLHFQDNAKMLAMLKYYRPEA